LPTVFIWKILLALDISFSVLGIVQIRLEISSIGKKENNSEKK